MLLSFLTVDADGPMNVSRLLATPHRTVRAGGLIDIAAWPRKIVFAGNLNAWAKMALVDGAVVIEKVGRVAKFVDKVDQVSFSGRRAPAQLDGGADGVFVVSVAL